MNPDNLIAHFKQLTKSLGGKQVAMLVLVFVAVVGVVVGSAYYMSSPNFSLLASDLDADSASALVNHLKDVKVPYELTDGGRTVRVPSERVDELRLDVAGTGLQSAGHIGFEIFDRPAFGTTEFLEQVNFRRALEGELSRTIGTLSDVSSARVHIAMGKDSLFADKSEPAKASVVLRLKSNRPLAPTTVKAITGLVANSVESLRPESVVVLDTYGRSLTQTTEEAEDTAGAVGLDRQQRIERDMSTHVLGMLESVVGAGHARVNVSARLKADAEDITEEHWDPASVIRSKQTISETDSHALSQGGSAGARANLPPASANPVSTPATANAAADPAAAGAPASPTPPTTPAAPPPAGAPISQQTTGSTKTSDTTNWEVGRVTTHRTNPSGQIARLSVAVILDEVREPAAAGSTTPPVAKPRPAEELQRIQKIVASAVGFDEARGDQLTVDSIAFDVAPQADAAPEPSGLSTVWEEVRTQVRDNWMSAVRTVSVLLVALVAIFGFLRPMARRAMLVPPPPATLPALAGAAAAGGAATGGAAAGRAMTVQELEGRLDDGGGPDAKARPLLARRVAQLASEEPEYVARIMRTWLTDEER